MAAKTQEENTPISEPGKSLTNKDGEITKLIEWATVDANSIEELERVFQSEGVSYSDGNEVTGDFRVITASEKQLFLPRVQGCPVFVIKWENRESATGSYVTVHLFIEGHGKFILNDGSKVGICGQLSRIESERLHQNPDILATHARAGVKVARGIVKNDDFYYDTRTGKAIKKGEEVPEEFRAKANPTWKFEF